MSRDKLEAAYQLTDLLTGTRGRSVRKRRLLECAFTRRVLPLLPDGPVKHTAGGCLALGEQWADNGLDLDTPTEDRSHLLRAYDFRRLVISMRQEVDRLKQTSAATAEPLRSAAWCALDAAERAILHISPSSSPDYWAGNAARQAFGCHAHDLFDPDWTDPEVHEYVQGQEAEVQLALARDIVGEPLRPVTLDPSWQTSTAVALAQSMYDARAFDRLPILADALEDAGCDHPDVLAHCRGPGPHVRGCWVVDLVLGKS